MSNIDFKNRIINLFNAENSINVNELILELYHHQLSFNPVFSNYVDHLNTRFRSARSIKDIAYLPISLFKEYSVMTGNWEVAKIFESSGTTASIKSKKMLKDANWYDEISQACFKYSFGKEVSNFCFLALLPHYLESGSSSLVHMLNNFIIQSKFEKSSFFQSDFARLHDSINFCKENNVPVILFGVSYALMDFFEKHKIDFGELIIIDTGGMKGRKKELTKQELYAAFSQGNHFGNVMSEYGMTELMSQAYALDGVNFRLPPNMFISVRDINDPYHEVGQGRPGVAWIIDLGNVDTCAFIATEDIVVKNDNDTFQMLGRLDNSDIRGCNLLWTG